MLLAVMVSLPCSAKVSEDKAAELGKTLTPVGAEMQGSKDGVIPAYTGGLPAKGTLSDVVYPSNPEISAEKPLFVITAANASQYADKLTAGHLELLRRFPSYKMNVYPTHRTVSFPEHIVSATKRNATDAELVGTDGVHSAVHGFPFPIPTNGAEVIWNHKVRWRGNFLRRYNNQMIVQPSGDFVVTRLLEDIVWLYTNPRHDGRSEDVLFKYRSNTLSPPRVAGDLLLVHETSDQANTPRLAWRYSPGIDRVNRAPEVGYDTPVIGTDGNQFYDQIDMFNGALDRYDWKLLGKKEMYIAYNSYGTASPTLTYAKMATPRHFNQDFARYEKHRVWVVEADLKKGFRHTFARRIFYVDEDSWAVSAVDCYDEHMGLFKFQESHQTFFQNSQAVGGLPEIIYDFASGRYFVTALANEDKSDDWSVTFDDSYFQATALRAGKRVAR